MLNLPKIYSQQDGRWGAKLLGFNTDPQYTICDYGCLISCLAMTACYFGYPVTPDAMNEFLKDVEGFSNGGFYNWGYITKIFDSIKEHWVGTPLPLSDYQINRIKTALDNGFPVMVQLDSNIKTSKLDSHYVLLIGYDPLDENNFTLADPLTGKAVSMRKYLSWWRPNARKTIEQFIIYEAEVLTDVARLESKIEKVETAYKNLYENYNKDLAKVRAECQNKLLEVRKSLEKVVDSI